MSTMLLLMGAAASFFCSAARAEHTNAYVYGGLSTMPGRQIYTYWHGEHAQVGAGGQAAFGRFTIGGDVTGLIATGGFQQSAAIIGGGPGFHFFNGTERKVDPFVTGGLSALVSGGAAGMYHYGGGLNYWFRPRLALRLEFRDHVWFTEGSGIHITGVRVGLTFR